MSKVQCNDCGSVGDPYFGGHDNSGRAHPPQVMTGSEGRCALCGLRESDLHEFHKRLAARPRKRQFSPCTWRYLNQACVHGCSHWVWICQHHIDTQDVSEQAPDPEVEPKPEPFDHNVCTCCIWEEQ